MAPSDEHSEPAGNAASEHAGGFFRRLFRRRRGDEQASGDGAGKRKRRLRMLAIGLPAFLIVVALSAEFTSRPEFCPTCHYMEPFYESWQTSTHADVSCVTCHFPPGLAGTVRGKVEGLVQVVNYVTRSYTRRKPWAEIDDASCLQSDCHATRKLEGSVHFKNVVFDHTAHLGELRRGKELRCTSCHSQVVQGEHIVVTETSCFLCHLKPDGDTHFPVPHQEATEVGHAATDPLSLTCQTCHNWSELPRESMADFRYDHSAVVDQGIGCTQCHNKVVQGDGHVPIDNCSSCHFERERLDQYENSELLHRTHIAERKIECIQCHLRIEHQVERLTVDAELDCTTCHAGTHQEQLFLLAGRDPEGYQGPPSPMFEAGLNCASCHVLHQQLLGQAGVQAGDPQACETCHGEGYARLLSLWEESSANKLRQLERDIAYVAQQTAGARADSTEVVRRQLAQARSGMHLVRVGKAVHNAAFADELVRKSYAHLNRALGAAGRTTRLTGAQTDMLVPNECANCHSGVEALASPFRGSTFSHQLHVAGQEIACQTCHSNARTHGQVILSEQGCNSCHHDPGRSPNACAACHETPAAFYAGTYAGLDTPDYMFMEDVACEDCHASGTDVRRPDASICADCHDDDYREMAEEWRADVQRLMEEVEGLLNNLPESVRRTQADENARAALADVRRSAAGGLHNYELTMELLGSVRDRLQAEE